MNFSPEKKKKLILIVPLSLFVIGIFYLISLTYLKPKQAPHLDQVVHTATNAPILDDALVARAKTIYLNNCALCHGADGNGHGALSASLKPHPVSLISSEPFRHYDNKSGESLSTYLHRVIENGIEGSPMPAFKNIITNKEDIKILSLYLEKLTFNKINNR